MAVAVRGCGGFSRLVQSTIVPSKVFDFSELDSVNSTESREFVEQCFQ